MDQIDQGFDAGIWLSVGIDTNVADSNVCSNIGNNKR
jgi:hypothetical protein